MILMLVRGGMGRMMAVHGRMHSLVAIMATLNHRVVVPRDGGEGFVMSSSARRIGDSSHALDGQNNDEQPEKEGLEKARHCFESRACHQLVSHFQTN